jgi:anti-anti-sigma factor
MKGKLKHAIAWKKRVLTPRAGIRHGKGFFKAFWGEVMLNVTVQTVDETTILRCQGRIVTGRETSILREAVLARPDTGKLIVDLRHVDAIDAGGLGLLLELREWARSKRVQLRLVNITSRVQHVLEATKLSRIVDVDLFKETDTQPYGAAGAVA